MTYTIEVTQADIDRGLRASCYSCPVALALYRSIKSNVQVGDSYLAVHIGDSITDIESPPIVKEFVFNFDRFVEVKPFTFTLDL